MICSLPIKMMFRPRMYVPENLLKQYLVSTCNTKHPFSISVMNNCRFHVLASTRGRWTACTSVSLWRRPDLFPYRGGVWLHRAND